MEHIKAHIEAFAQKRDSKKERSTERGELMEYFLDHLNRARVRDGLAPMSMPRMGKVLQLIPTKDLYYLQSVCDKATDFSKKFWWEVKPKNHTPEAKAAAKKVWEKSAKKRAPEIW